MRWRDGVVPHYNVPAPKYWYGDEFYGDYMRNTVFGICKIKVIKKLLIKNSIYVMIYLTVFINGYERSFYVNKN